MNLLIKLKPSTNLEWFQERLLSACPQLKDCGIIYDTPCGKDISVFVSIDDKEERLFSRRIILISPQVLSVQRA